MRGKEHGGCRTGMGPNRNGSYRAGGQEGKKARSKVFKIHVISLKECSLISFILSLIFAPCPLPFALSSCPPAFLPSCLFLSHPHSKVLVRRVVMVAVLGVWSLGLVAQNSRFRPVDLTDPVYHLTVKKMVIPAVLVGYGFAGMMINPVKEVNLSIRSEITSWGKRPFHIDNFSQYSPAALVYGLNLAGIKGKHNFLDRSIVLASSLAVMGISVGTIKYLSNIQRPDGTSFNSFPSGHTATAFACAEFLYQEYKDVSVWYGIAGYGIAAGTGFLRMYNNRHWLTDVLAGAGFGMVSTKVAYWIFPKVKKLFFKNMDLSFSFVPYLNLRNDPLQ